NACGAGSTLTTTAPDTIALSGGSIGANSTCECPITVTGATVGAKTNTTGAISSTEGGQGNAATANVTVVAPPSIAKAFGAATIALNGTGTLNFTITNPPANTVALSGVAFTDTLPAGLTAANGTTADVCGTGSSLAITGGDTLTLTGRTIPPRHHLSL